MQPARWSGPARLYVLLLRGQWLCRVHLKNNLCLPSLPFQSGTERQHGSDLPDATLFDHAAGELRFVDAGDLGTTARPHAHPSGEYVFLENTNYLTDILQVDLIRNNYSDQYHPTTWRSSAQMVCIYGDNPDNAEIRIAGFNAANGEVSWVGSVILPHVIDGYWFPAERY